MRRNKSKGRYDNNWLDCRKVCDVIGTSYDDQAISSDEKLSIITLEKLSEPDRLAIALALCCIFN